MQAARNRSSPEPANDMDGAAWPLSPESIIEIEKSATLRITVHFPKDSVGYLEEKKQAVLNSIKKNRAQKQGRETWEHWANISFDEVESDEADIRVGFDARDGPWSYIGQGAKNHKGITLNLPIDPRVSPSENDFGTILHEFGHALGLHYEYQIQIRDLEVAKLMRRHSGQYIHGIWVNDSAKGTTKVADLGAIANLNSFDPDSIMIYQSDGAIEGTNKNLSMLDKAFIMLNYPPDLTNYDDHATEERLSRFKTAIRHAGLESKAGEILHAFLDPRPVLNLAAEESQTIYHRLQAMRKRFREYNRMVRFHSRPGLLREFYPAKDMAKNKLFQSLVRHMLKNAMEHRGQPVRETIPRATPIEAIKVIAGISTHEEIARSVKSYKDDFTGVSSPVAGRSLNGVPYPADVKQYILNLLRVIKIRGGFLSPTESLGSDPHRFSNLVPALLQYMETVESGDLMGNKPEDTAARGELDDLEKELTDALNNRPDDSVPSDVQHGLLTKLPGIRNILDWFSNTVSETRTDVRKVTSGATDKMLAMLRNNPPQNIFQEVYHLCFASTFVHDVNGTQKALQKKLQMLLESLLPKVSKPAETAGGATERGWELVWGPVVWKVAPEDGSGGPDLAWYIAYNGSVRCGDNEESGPTYVIAIAGTQARSVHTWLNSNFDVTSPIDFKSWISNLRSSPGDITLPKVGVDGEKPYIARGTASTVRQLLTIPPPSRAKAEGRSLLAFVEAESRSNPNLKIITTGHSLGGALSPTLAAVLVELDIISHDRILTYPIAGPSPGNDAFAKFFADTFLPIPAKQDELESRKYQVWNFNIVNARDPVPQAWCSDKKAAPRQNLQNIEGIIPGSHLRTIFSAIISSVIEDLSDAGVRYMPLRSQVFSARPSKAFKDVRPQHSAAYHEYVGVTPPDLREALRESD